MRLRGSVVAGLALALFAGGASAQDPRRVVAPDAPDAPTAQALRVGGLVGFEIANGETGFGLRADGELPIQAIGPRIDLTAVGSLGFTRFSDSSSTSLGSYSQSTNLFKLVPAARFTLPLTPAVGVYGDAGLGLYWARSSVDTPFGDGSSSGVGVTMRFAAGGFYEMTPQLRLGAELGLNPYFGDFSEDTLSVLASLTFRL